jgi:hypothetical protein
MGHPCSRFGQFCRFTGVSPETSIGILWAEERVLMGLLRFLKAAGLGRRRKGVKNEDSAKDRIGPALPLRACRD